MEDNKQVIGIRCHGFGEPEQLLYKVLLQYFQASRVFFMVDEIEDAKKFPTTFNKISLSAEFLENNKLYKPNRAAWSCGDYFYYAFRATVEADYYWLIEPDVLLNLDSVEDFFKFFANKEIDALVTHFTLATPEWSWYESAKRLLETPYRCFFPLTRLSGQAIDIMLAKRQALSLKFVAEQSRAQFPNDEALLANALMAAGITPINLTDYFPNSFDKFSIGPFKNRGLSTRYHKNQVIHPVKDSEFYTAVFKKHINTMFDKQLAHLLDNLSLNDQELKQVQNTVLELFSQRLTEDFYVKGKLKFTLQALAATFRTSSEINFKKFLRDKNELRFFMGKAKCIVFAFTDQTIVVYKRIYTQGVAEPTETKLKTLPLAVSDSVPQIQAKMEAILRLHENKPAMLEPAALVCKSV
ncbi:MAG: hypothetical protein E6Q83_00705 [Thiothrix sp.]|nr:MAG: hypothetical protein E6Q83_00705 [Thiothrix sp.]